MITGTIPSRQPSREAWTIERLDRELAVALNASVDLSTKYSYGSALNSWIEFCRLHNLPTEPTEKTLAYFVVYCSHHIKPKSVDSYLSGICQQLEPLVPNVRAMRKSLLVSRALKGAQRLLYREMPLDPNPHELRPPTSDPAVAAGTIRPRPEDSASSDSDTSSGQDNVVKSPSSHRVIQKRRTTEPVVPLVYEMPLAAATATPDPGPDPFRPAPKTSSDEQALLLTALESMLARAVATTGGLQLEGSNTPSYPPAIHQLVRT
ncbi:RNase H domain-containing protein [Mycena kentingensis (nom. inval.)]|nr:RNase H domain-containing protein [Mycena kentingensis (nom. inval.)]